MFSGTFLNMFIHSLDQMNLAPPQSDSPEEEELHLTLNSLSAELHKLDDIHWICPLMQCSEEVRSRMQCCIGTLDYAKCHNSIPTCHVVHLVAWQVFIQWCVCFSCQDSVRSSSKSSSMKLKIIPKVKKEREKLHKQKSNSSLSGRRPRDRDMF